MDLLTTILTCSLYASDDALVRAIAEGPGESNAYRVVNIAADPTDAAALAAPRTDKEATAYAADLIAKGGRPLLGLLELPPSWLDAFGRDLASAFDPCTNVAIGTAMLSAFDSECRASLSSRGQAAPLERVNRRACVIGKYGAALGSEDFALAIQLELSAQRPMAPAIEDAPIFAPLAPGHWGPDQLLVQLTPAASPPSRLP